MLAQESCDIWMIFQSFCLKPSTHTFCHKGRGKIGVSTIGIIQLVITISQDHPVTPDRLRLSETKINFVDSLLQNYVKYKKQLLLPEPPPATIEPSISHADISQSA